MDDNQWAESIGLLREHEPIWTNVLVESGFSLERIQFLIDLVGSEQTAYDGRADSGVEEETRTSFMKSLRHLIRIEHDLQQMDGNSGEALTAGKNEIVRDLFLRSCHWIKPLISVITPTYNRPAALCEMLECLVRQTVIDFECIIVNDAGDSVDWVKRRYPELNITILDQPVNGKHTRARNVGLTAAKGTYILLCDDDDLLMPDHMKRMLEALMEDPCDLVYCDAEIVEYELRGNTRMPKSRLLFAYDSDLQAMRKFSTFIPSGCLYRMEIHQVIGAFDEDIYHYWDWDFFLRVSALFKVKRVPAASVLYAFASSNGENLSADADQMRPFLDKLSAKHDLGWLPTKNFYLLLEEEGVKMRRSNTEVLWDGTPTVSRYELHRVSPVDPFRRPGK